MEGWDYSVLSHNACQHGGPEKYIEDIKKNAYQAAIKATDKSYQIAMETSDKKWIRRTLPLMPFAAVGLISVSLKIAQNFKRSL